jgi:hypothetical protein
MRAHLDGRFDEAAELSEKAYAYGRQSHAPHALQVHLVQTLFLRLDRSPRTVIRTVETRRKFSR